MNNHAYFSQQAPVFHGKQSPEDGYIVGYAAIIDKLKLRIPIPYPIALICNKNKNYETNEWKILPKTYLPEDHHNLAEIEALYKHLVFALKYEGINLLVFSSIVKHYSTHQLTELVNIEPTGQYSRRIWFLIEWIMGRKLEGKEEKKPEEKKSKVGVKELIKGKKIPGPNGEISLKTAYDKKDHP